MASSTVLKENFILCSVCLHQFKEPKLLPCLHRFCTDCLETVIFASKGGKVSCPICKQQCVVPENGVDGYKTDFHMKNILEFIQLQKQLENKDLKICVSCLKKINVSAYCFKCRDFLCDQCYNVHVTSKMFIDHRKRTLKLDKTERGTLTLEKLSSLSENPICRSHEEEYAKLCCTTCGNEPVCIICTYDKHKGHELRDVAYLAKTERDLLKRNRDELIECEYPLLELPKKIKTSMKQLNENVSLKTEEVVEQHRQQSDKIKSKLDDEKDARVRGLSDIENRRKSENEDINIKYDIEFKILKQKFDKIREETKTKFDNEYQQFNQKCDKIEESLLLMKEKLDDSLRSLTTAAELLKLRKHQKLSEISEYCNQIIKKYENFISTTSSILAAEVDWTDVRCIPDLNTAWEVLIEEMKSEFPEAESLSVADTSHIAEVIFDYIAIAEHEEKVLKGFLAKGWKIYGITTSGDSIIITGSALEGQSHITVCDRNGKIKRQDCIKSEALQGLGPVRCCSNLIESKVATVCQPDEIGIYDIRDGSYKKKLISEITDDWLDDQSVFCVTTDPDNNNIIVGTDSRYVYVFDDQLNYKQTLLLPDVITAPHEITVHEGHLLVCDNDGEKAYAVTMKEWKSTVVYQFTPPDQEKDDWSPCSVCTDQNKFIYMVWASKVSDHPRDVLVQYSQDGRNLLAIKDVYGAVWVSTLSETLLIATTKKIYSYGLKVT